MRAPVDFSSALAAKVSTHEMSLLVKTFQKNQTRAETVESI
jgi:hypothetical protein